jgi:signal transduction histidine kinase
VSPVNEGSGPVGGAPSSDELARAGKATLLGQLLSGVTHELNNPLLAVLGLVDLLAADAQPESQAQRRLTLLRETALEMRATVRGLLDFAREPAGDDGPFDLAAAAREALDFAGRTSAAKGVELVSDLPSEPVPVSGSRPRLEQALLHLLANAYDAVAGEGTITLALTREGNEAAVTVSDSGGGVPADIRDRVFDPFFTTKADRSGLGLSAARAIAVLHGGRLELREGSTFVLTLPVSG